MVQVANVRAPPEEDHAAMRAHLQHVFAECAPRGALRPVVRTASVEQPTWKSSQSPIRAVPI